MALLLGLCRQSAVIPPTPPMLMLRILGCAVIGVAARSCWTALSSQSGKKNQSRLTAGNVDRWHDRFGSALRTTVSRWRGRLKALQPSAQGSEAAYLKLMHLSLGHCHMEYGFLSDEFRQNTPCRMGCCRLAQKFDMTSTPLREI